MDRRTLAGILIGVLSAATASAAPPHLRARWHLEEAAPSKAADSSGNGHDGTITGAKSVAGKFGKALQFGKGDYVKILANPNLEPNQVSVEAWIKGQPPGAFVYVLGKGGHGCSFSSYALYTAGGNGLFFYIASSTSYYRSPDAGPGVWDDRWHHVAGTYDGMFVRLYLDGVEVEKGTDTGGAAIKYGLLHTDDLFIGSYRGSCNLEFTDGKPGTIDEVSIWDYALSCQEVAEHAKASTPGVP